MKNTIKEEFIDEKGNKSEIIITKENDKKLNWKANYKLQVPEFNNKYMKKGAKGKGIFTSDIGVKSQGFAPIITLAALIAIAAIAVAFLMWRL